MTSQTTPDSRTAPFRILSLDGGGVRGAFAASFLAELEKRWGRPTADFFDLIAGTSTGGIVAASLSYGIPALQVVEIYQRKGAEIFKRPKPRSLSERIAPLAYFIPVVRGLLKSSGTKPRDLLHCRYSPVALTSALHEVFGEQKIGDIEKCRLLLLTADLASGRPKAIKTPHLPNMIRDRHYRIVDALLTTTAAPTYFPSHQIEPGSCHVDGGLWANNPSVCAIAEACRIGRESVPEAKQFGTGVVEVWSIGTGRPHATECPVGDRSGLISWRTAIDTSMKLQGQGTVHQAEAFLGERYHRIDFEMPVPAIELDDATKIDHLIGLGVQEFNEIRNRRMDTLSLAQRKFDGWLDSDLSASPRTHPVGVATH